MSTLLVSVIAIMLFGIVMVVGMVYFDVDETTAIGRSGAVSSHLSSLVEASETFRQGRGNYPLSISDLRTEFPMDPISSLSLDYVIDDSVACISLPRTETSEKAMQAARPKLLGSVVTDTCGSVQISGRRFLAVSLDGTNVPSASPF